MNKEIVYTIKELELENCVFTKPVLVQDKDKRNYYKGDVILNDHKGFIIQTPKLKLRSFTDYSVDILVGRNKDRDKEFYRVLTHLEDIVSNNISRNAQDWFTRNLTKDQVDLYLMKSCVKCPLNIDEPFIVKIEKTNNLINFSPNDYIVCLIKVDGLIVNGTSARLDLKIVHAKIIPRDFEKISHISSADAISDHSIRFSEAQSHIVADKESIKEKSPELIKEKSPEELEQIKLEYLKASIYNNIEYMENNKMYN